MAKILVVDDETLYQKMVTHVLSANGHEAVVASNGADGLELAREAMPDAIVSDVVMPEMNGYEFVRNLRSSPEFGNTPILMLTSSNALEEKIQAFESGADDHLTKPFEAAELIVRLTALLTRAAQAAPQMKDEEEVQHGKVIAVHSLRGGVGATTLSVNLALALRGLWNAPTIIVDGVQTSGQVALMLNTPLNLTWANLSHIAPEDLDMHAMKKIIGKDDRSGLYYIASPPSPLEAEALTPEIMERMLDNLVEHFKYVIVDISHDFRDLSLQVLDRADEIVYITAPELASARMAIMAVNTYRKLGYPDEKIRVALNQMYESSGLSRKKLEQSLKMSISQIIPYADDLALNAINFGRPIVTHHPGIPFTKTLEDFAYILSLEEHKEKRPDKPTNMWERVRVRHF